MKRVSPETYAEVYEIINKFAFVYDKIPQSVVRHIKNHASKTFVVQYPKNENILYYVSKEALELYTALYLEYAASEAQKAEMKEILVNNEILAKQE